MREQVFPYDGFVELDWEGEGFLSQLGESGDFSKVNSRVNVIEKLSACYDFFERGDSCAFSEAYDGCMQVGYTFLYCCERVGGC